MNEYMSEYSGMHVLEECTNITFVIFVSEAKPVSGVFMMTKWPEALQCWAEKEMAMHIFALLFIAKMVWHLCLWLTASHSPTYQRISLTPTCRSFVPRRVECVTIKEVKVQLSVLEMDMHVTLVCGSTLVAAHVRSTVNFSWFCASMLR